MTRTLGQNVVLYGFLLAIAAVMILPVYWLVLSSLRPITELSSLEMLPRNPTLENYVITFRETGVLQWLINSLFVAVTATVIGLSIGSLAAYSFAMHEFPGRAILFFLILASVTVSVVRRSPVFQLDGWKFHGSSSSSRLWG